MLTINIIQLKNILLKGIGKGRDRNKLHIATIKFWKNKDKNPEVNIEMRGLDHFDKKVSILAAIFKILVKRSEDMNLSFVKRNR